MREERFMVVPLHLQFIILLCDGCFVVILFVGLCGIEHRGKIENVIRRKTTTKQWMVKSSQPQQQSKIAAQKKKVCN